MQIQLQSEDSLVIRFEQKIDEAQHQKIVNLAAIIEQVCKPLIRDIVVAYASILVIFDLTQTTGDALSEHINIAIEANISQKKVSASRHIKIPIFFGAAVAPDLAAICEHKQLSQRQFIASYLKNNYRIYCIGFAPNFAYMGTVSAKLAVTRKAKPRLKVPKGSLAIADQQTAIYPTDSPGGWQIIGRCPPCFIDGAKDSIATLKVGDYVRFEAVTLSQFLSFGGQC